MLASFLFLGKSLYIDRLFEKFQQISPRAKHISLKLIEPSVDVDSLIRSLSEKLEPLREQDPVILHIDTSGVSMQAFTAAGRLVCCCLCLSLTVYLVFTLDTSQVRSGLEELLFHLLVLGCLNDSHGMLWRRNVAHLITVEVLKTYAFPPNHQQEVMSFLDPH